MPVAAKILLGTGVVAALAAAPKWLAHRSATPMATPNSASEAALYYLATNSTSREYIRQNIGGFNDRGTFVYLPSFLQSLSVKPHREPPANSSMRFLMENWPVETVKILNDAGFEIIRHLEDNDNSRYTFWAPTKVSSQGISIQ